MLYFQQEIYERIGLIDCKLIELLICLFKSSVQKVLNLKFFRTQQRKQTAKIVITLKTMLKKNKKFEVVLKMLIDLLSPSLKISSQQPENIRQLQYSTANTISLYIRKGTRNRLNDFSWRIFVQKTQNKNPAITAKASSTNIRFLTVRRLEVSLGLAFATQSSQFYTRVPKCIEVYSRIVVM